MKRRSSSYPFSHSEQSACTVLIFLFLSVLLENAGCSETSQTGGSQSDLDSESDTEFNGSDVQASCETLFGQPNENTGLTREQCRPVCSCNGDTYQYNKPDQELIDSLLVSELQNPLPPLETNPYDDPALDTSASDSVCGVVLDEASDDVIKYKLVTYAGEYEAKSAGAIISHYGACGRCSSLRDLAIYMDNPDLADPVRQCVIVGIFESDEASLECLEQIGFSRACSEIWYYNMFNTRHACFDVCFPVAQTNHLSDGSLNPCLQCDEEKSGPVFKAIAGRTRRNSGIPTALCRPCESVGHLSHIYK